MGRGSGWMREGAGGACESRRRRDWTTHPELIKTMSADDDDDDDLK